MKHLFSSRAELAIRNGVLTESGVDVAEDGTLWHRAVVAKPCSITGVDPALGSLPLSLMPGDVVHFIRFRFCKKEESK